MADGWQRLHQLEEQAAAWLAAAPTRLHANALFDAFLHILKYRHADLYDDFMPLNEALIESTLCMSRDQASMPLPLPDSSADCACAELTGVTVDAVFLSGSTRENSSVSLMDSCVSDVDVMLRLGGVLVEEEVAERPGAPSNTAAATECAAPQSDASRPPQAAETAVRSQKVDGRGTGVVNGRPTEPVGNQTTGLHVGGQETRAVDHGTRAVTSEAAVGEELGAVGGDVTVVGRGLDGGAAPGRQPEGAGAGDGREGIVLTMERTDQPGFFLLRHRRRSSCRHRQRLPLSARRVVGLMDTLRQAVTRKSPSYSGPAVSATVLDFSQNARDVDLVACVRCPAWPSADFASRPRPSGSPDAALVARLCRTAAFLVPVGFRGSATETLQWRLSFSRHEYIVLRHMTIDQRMCFTALKYCRAVVGEAAKPLKSYYLKTALLWLAESRPADQWTPETMHDSLLLMLRYLDVCLRRGYLPCYFWPEVNLLAGRSAAELTELAAAVTELRRRLLPAVLALLADWLGQPVPALAQRLLLRNDRLPADQFWGLTVSGALRRELSRSSAATEDDSDDSRDGDLSSEPREGNLIANLVFRGRNQTSGPLAASHPAFVGMSLSMEVFQQIAERETGANPLIGFLSMFQRGENAARDSWLQED